MHLTLYRGAKDPVPLREDNFASWNEVVEALADAVETEAPTKTALLAIAPHRLTRPYRLNENVNAVTALMIDVDGCDLDAVRARLDALGCASLVYGTPSDDASAAERRVRVVAPATRPMTVSECGPARLRFAEALGLAPGCGTEACLEAARLNFIGRLEGTPARLFETTDGPPVNVDVLLATPLVHAWHAPERAAPAERATPAAPANSARTVAAAAILAALGDPHAHDGYKHDICGALGGLLRRLGWTADECATLVRAWLPAGDAAVDVEAGVRWACGAWSRPATDVSGETALRAALGTDTAALVVQAARLARHAPAHENTPARLDAPATAHEASFTIVDRSRPPPELVYVCEGLGLAVGKVSVLQAYANVAKTPFALSLALHVAAGRAFMGHPVRQCATWYGAFEGGVLTEEREARLCAGMGLVRADVPLHYARANAELGERFLEDLDAYVTAHTIGLAVVDTYGSALPPDVDHNSSAFAHWLRQLGRLSEATSCVVLVLMHENKSDRADGMRGISGHNSAAGAIQAAMRLVRRGDDRNVITCECTREVRHAFTPFAVRFADAPDGGLTVTRVEAPAEGRIVRAKVERAERAHDVRTACHAVVRQLRGVEGWLSRAELRLRCAQVPRATVDAALARLEGAGLAYVNAGSYALTDTGRDATPAAIDTAAGVVAGRFTRA